MNYQYLFGPVSSRRLGMSLGIDLVPQKVCNLNCIYCESGATITHTNEVGEYLPVNEIIRELDHYLASNPDLDYITFSGAGEPTLNKGFAEIVSYIKTKHAGYKLALITNGILLSNKDIQRAALECDLVLPSLDAVTESVFRKINRPWKGIKVEEVIAGLIEFSSNFKGQLWMEVFVLPGINDSKEEILKIKEVLMDINPEKVQLNTLDRPGTVSDLKPLNLESLEAIQAMMLPLNVEVVSRAKLSKHIATSGQKISEGILNTIKRRPCTLDDLVRSLGSNTNEIERHLKNLLHDGLILKEKNNAGAFYKLK